MSQFVAARVRASSASGRSRGRPTIPIHDAVPAFCEVLENKEFLLGQMKGALTSGHGPRGEVDRDAPERQPLDGGSNSPKHVTHPREKLFEIERFCDVVVCAKLPQPAVPGRAERRDLRFLKLWSALHLPGDERDAIESNEACTRSPRYPFRSCAIARI